MTYKQILREIRDKYNINRLKEFQAYENRLKGMRKAGRLKASPKSYLLKKAKRLAQTSKATYQRIKYQSKTLAQLEYDFKRASEKVKRQGGKPNSQQIRQLRTMETRLLKKKVALETDLTKKGGRQLALETFEAQKRANSQFFRYSSYTGRKIDKKIVSEKELQELMEEDAEIKELAQGAEFGYINVRTKTIYYTR